MTAHDYGLNADGTERFDIQRLANEIWTLERIFETKIRERSQWSDRSPEWCAHQAEIQSLSTRALLLETRLQGELSRLHLTRLLKDV